MIVVMTIVAVVTVVVGTIMSGTIMGGTIRSLGRTIPVAVRTIPFLRAAGTLPGIV
jgi:hypothetical protein